ncbi:FtsK/SpoIIIE domain-containing protein [Acetobacter pasteurianus]|uniref:FtsK/SpoIIIE domain-containing protein n=1 Tax=Acetobacter pasteurianus TaxID=438 RepID=UPI00055872B6|nr:FtsK/SpoIIIE domain-containing protein [Acetobacter pasteurianus]GCD50584.1 cell division protein FtsK [Acetobacter pasteurianus subsp. pasteurianus LMG 1262 = NBRC 106471]
MTPTDLIGAAGAAFLRMHLNKLIKGDGVARYLLDRLTGEQVVAIARALLKDPHTANQLKIALPRSLVAGHGLPESVVTDERTVAVRHAECDRPALLLANTDEDQGASLSDVTLIGAKQLTQTSAPWVEAASAGLGLPENQLKAWNAALKGLNEADGWTLYQIANYVALTRTLIAEKSVPVPLALGWALPALHLPRDSGYFCCVREKDMGHASRWRKLFEKLITERKPLLHKYRPNRQIIESAELQTHFESVKDDIDSAVYPTIEAFINAPSGWNEAASALSQFEWEKDGVLQLFSNIRRQKQTLAQDTLNFFEFTLPGQLTESDIDYLQTLERRKPREAQDEDRDFFESHRDNLSQDKKLRVQWERFIFGRPIDCTDFLEGLLSAIERLFGQVNLTIGPRKLTIKPINRTPSKWLSLNADIGLAFAQRYRGLPALMGPNVIWDKSIDYIFEYEKLLEKAKKSKKYRTNVSTARAALQIKFDVTLSAGSEQETVQLIWIGQPNAIGSELPEDISRLIERPFVRCKVARLPVSRKGALQSVSLADVGTLQPAFGQNSGTLVSRVSNSSNIEAQFKKNLKKSIDTGRLTQANYRAITETWGEFSNLYTQALQAWQKTGYASPKIIKQAEAYGRLLKVMSQHATGDINRRDLWFPLLELGIVSISGGAPSAIVAPWQPLRLAASAAKMRSLAGLTNYLLSDVDINFGDSRLFFSDLRDELAHPLYPEIAVGYNKDEPVLLTETGTLNEYSLFERPVLTPLDTTTDVDPTEAARQIRGLLDRYLELQPHECSNLSIMLYNCDTAGLPLATVNALNSVQDEQEEVQCNILVCHRSRDALSDVYSDLLERSGNDGDAVVISETSRNFMSKLRISMMLEGESTIPAGTAREVDIAFLHDVVSHQAREQWFRVPAMADNPTLLDHVPARWSYRRVTAEDELQASSYLTCPRQPDACWAYIDAAAQIIRQQTHSAEEHYLPARQISFQNSGLKTMFDEVHKLAEWVATYDDLLDKRQLEAMGIKVIRYRRQHTNGRNMVISSTSELRTLHVLVKRRLSELSLGLDDERLSALAKRMIDDANTISGDISLRAAKRGISAGELIGLVLSRALVAEELHNAPATAWFLLDDYATWLGQREEGIADILALSVVQNNIDETPKLRAIVTEAKYVDVSGVADATRKSRQQLRQTVIRIKDALFGAPGRLDRDLWLSRIADMLLDGDTTLGHTNLLENVRNSIRQGQIAIDLRGYSHVFTSTDPSNDQSPGNQELILEIPDSLQETFTRSGLRQLITAYEAGTPLSTVRKTLGEHHVWEKTVYHKPASRVEWISTVGLEDLTAPTMKTVDTSDMPTKASSTVEPIPTLDALLRKDDAHSLLHEAATSVVPATQHIEQILTTTTPTADNALNVLICSHTEHMHSNSAEEQLWLETTAQQLRTALLGYNLQANIIGTRLTPNAALIRFRGSDRLHVSDIEAKQSALLTTHGLRLIAVSPMPGEIVVSVARPERQIVSLWDIWARRQLNRNETGMNTSFVLGLKELDGDILYLNLGSAFAGEQRHDPHTLIAGATGSGKSVLIQTLLLDIAATNTSNLAHIYLIDPKNGVDYAAITQLPHLQGGIVTDQTEAIKVMEELIAEMERRYKLFQTHRARDIQTFNVKAPVAERLPCIFLVHDEFAEWMLIDEYKTAVTTSVSRLGVKARAAGIHLIFAAQRPDKDVMPVQLRDNLGNRLILKVASAGTSEIALGIKGAEQLLGHGHLAARLSGEPCIIYAQAPFLSDQDMEAAAQAISTAE